MKIKDAFQNMVAGYTPATMWFTKGNIDKKEMTYQIEGFKEQGICDFFIHPSSGTQGDYLGDHFFSMIKHAAKEAERLGINYWIYDEYNWPSGVAGGQVLTDEPWTHGSCLTKVIEEAAPGETVRVALPEQKVNNTKVLLVIAGGQRINPTLDGDTVVWTNTASVATEIEVYFSAWTLRKIAALKDSEVIDPDVVGFLDTLDKEAVQVFIQKTHEAYKKHIGEGFGKYVKGVFTDEVPTFPQSHGETRPEYPWSRLFAEKFEERNGYDIIPHLKALMEATDPKLTVDYWETVTDLFMSAFMDLTYQWCTDNNLIYTGHLLAEESLPNTLMRSGDPYEYYKRFTWPGIDSILTYYWINHFDYNITAKRASSAAHFLNKERVSSETFTVSGWEIRLRDMKRVFNRLALLGVNFIEYMGSSYDFMPAKDSVAMTNNWQNPLYKHYGELSRYISGIQWMIANSTYDAHTLLFYPVTAARIALPPSPTCNTNYENDIDLTLYNLVNSLLILGVPFEMGFEQVLEEAEVVDGSFLINGAAYDTLILPCTTYLKEKTFQKLESFAESGGRIIQVNGMPQWVIGSQVYEASLLKDAVSFDCYEYEAIRVGHALERSGIGAFTNGLKRILGDPTGMAVRLEPCDAIMSATLKRDEDYYVMLINDYDSTEICRGEVLIELPFRALNTENGELKPMKVDGAHFEIELAPYECVVIELSASVNTSSFDASDVTQTEIILKNTAFIPKDANTALPTMWQVRGDACSEIQKAREVYNPKRVCDLAASLTEEDLVLCRSAANIYDSSSGKTDWFGWTPVDGVRPAPGESAVCIYDFAVDEVPEVLELVSDPQYNTVWYLNNQQIYQTASRRVWHYANPVYDLSGIAIPGKNRLIAICTLPSYNSATFTLPCAVLKGSFRFFEDQILTQKPGGNALCCWNEQGYMCYTGDGSYTATFTAPPCEAVILEIDTMDVAEVFVNGRSAGKRLWDPYRIDLTPFLIFGENQLEIRVTSTYSNFLYNSTPSGIKGAKLWALKYD